MTHKISAEIDSALLKKFGLASQIAARRGGEVLLDMLGRANVWQKGPGDWVTQADFESQKIIRQFLLEQFPGHGFLGEEDDISAASMDETADKPDLATNSEYCWIVDPLDGTANYVHQLASFSVSVALRHRDPQTGVDQIVAGTVFDPTMDECFSAIVGGGATLNGTPIQTSTCGVLDEALTVFSMGSQVAANDPAMKRLLNVLATASTVRRLGSAALNLCYVACGRIDAYWAANLKPWDVAAGWLIALESGSVLQDFDDRALDLMKPKFCCAGTRELFVELQPLLRV